MFGAGIDWDAFISRALDGIRKPPNYVYTKQLLIELYETHYGIHDHTKSGNPLASVLQNDAEMYLNDYIYDNYFSTFLYKEIYHRTGLSFDALMDKPRFEIEKIFELVDEYNKKRSTVSANALNDFKDLDKP